MPAGMSNPAAVRRAMAIVLVAVLVAGCRGSSELDRTGLDRWKARTFAKIGMRMDIPADAEFDSDPSFGLTVRLHPVRPPTLKLADTRYLITLHVERTSLTPSKSRWTR